jgi:demethylsterigmatocystin 6-O-methyltransferase
MVAVFPFEAELGDFAGPRVPVDVGGGFGHQCVALQARYPELRGRLVLQDLPQALEHLPPPLAAQLGGVVEQMAHDVFQEQPVRGARFVSDTPAPRSREPGPISSPVRARRWTRPLLLLATA